jgi:transcriptional regulator with PAS, ATPase and Fis domain
MADIQSIKNRFGIIGNSPALNHAIDVAVQVSSTDLSVLINGESGVGKEVFSHIIHSLSPRKHNSFIAVNCGAIPEGTIDSELFGHEKGSFTGAVDSRKGYFEAVNGGTIFLDEIGELPLGTQARLLRVLETGEFIRVGSSKVQKTDVRVIAATNRDLLEFAQNGRFRLDLYYRLNSVPIRIPALRDRKEDIPLLFRKFVIDFAERYRTNPVQLEEDARQMLINYPWRGNVRELKNIAEQISVLAKNNNVNGREMAAFLPTNNPEQPPVAGLPVLAGGANGFVSETTFANEREILYKLFFDMKRDVTELKKMMFEIVQNPGAVKASTANYRFDDGQDGTQLPDPTAYQPAYPQPARTATPQQPVFIQPATNGKPAEDIHEHEEVDESLSIVDMEKNLIVKALKKHKGKRKDAASDLGISERTLYRKLKEYDIEE